MSKLTSQESRHSAQDQLAEDASTYQLQVTRAPISVQTYEIEPERREDTRKRKRQIEAELKRMSQPALPICYVDREAYERMR